MRKIEYGYKKWYKKWLIIVNFKRNWLPIFDLFTPSGPKKSDDGVGLLPLYKENFLVQICECLTDFQ